MDRKAVLGRIMLILLLISMLTLAPPIQLALAEPETMLYIDPSETNVSVGNTFIIDVNLGDVVDLYGYDIWLSYNTSLLDVISVGPPHLLPEPIIEIIEPDGIIHIYKILFPPEPPVTGSGTLASVTFNATASGSSILDLFDTMLVDPYLSQIHHTVIDGSVAVLSMTQGRWAVIEDVNDDRLKVETANDEIWSTLVELYHNRSERWIGGIVEEYDNEWRFRFDPNTVIVAEVVIEVWQTTIRGISGDLDYWLGNMACVGAKVVEINPLRVPDDYPTIQEAINAASDGSTILVASGTYYEHVVVNKTVSLIGENKSTTIIDGNGTGNVVTITVSNVTIRDFTIQKSGPYSPYTGISLLFSNYTTIENNTITDNAWGIDLYRSYNTKIRNNNIVNSTDMDGVYLYRSINNWIGGNNVTNNRYGIFLSESGNNTIIDNRITRNRYWGIQVWGLEANYNVIANNSVSNNGFAHFVGLDGIYIDLSSNNAICNNTIGMNARDGVRFSRSSNNTVCGNKIFGNEGGAGILLSSWDGRNSTNNMIIENYFAGNEYGIYLDRSNDNFIYHNNFINNTRQVLCRYGLEVNIWDDGYPSGGNYWGDYAGEDNYSGLNQDQPGSDGIGDIPYPIDADNQDSYPLMKSYGGPHDIGITVVTTSKTVVGQAYSLNITVRMLNYGIYAEDRNVTVYANATAIASRNVTLTSRNSTIVTFTWNTAGFAYGNYTINAYANHVPGETDIADNTFANGVVMVTIPGDVNGDRIVDIFDTGFSSAHWYPGPPVGPLGYDANADINGDGAVDIFDVGIASAQWGQSW